MSIKEIELAITQLTPEELFRFTVWFEEFQAGSWDEQIKKDIEAGRLDKLIKEAEEDFKAGRCIGIVRSHEHLQYHFLPLRKNKINCKRKRHDF